VRGLTVIVAVADAPRLHAALSIAAASAASGAATRVYIHGDAVGLLAGPLQAPEDERHCAAGLPMLAELFEEALGLGVRLICCQTGLLLSAIAADRLDPRIEIGGLVGLFAALGDDRLVTV
jgi:predicted peroxiredoxin